MDSELCIPGYLTERKDRSTDGGGVCVHIRNDVAYNRRTDLNSDTVEAVWIDILLPKTKPILTGICYRPPKDNNFYINLETILAPTVSFQNELLILGDFNINVSKGPECGLTRKLMSFMDTFNMTQIIKDSTRVTGTKSIIDLIMVSDVDKISQQGVLPSGLSDHFIIYCTRKTVKSLLNKHHTTIIRSMKHYSKEMLTELLQTVDWSPVLNCLDVNEAWTRTFY